MSASTAALYFACLRPCDLLDRKYPPMTLKWLAPCLTSMAPPLPCRTGGGELMATILFFLHMLTRKMVSPASMTTLAAAAQGRRTLWMCVPSVIRALGFLDPAPREGNLRLWCLLARPCDPRLWWLLSLLWWISYECYPRLWWLIVCRCDPRLWCLLTRSWRPVQLMFTVL